MTKDKTLVRASERDLLEKEILNKKFKEFDRLLHQWIDTVGKLEKRIEELEKKGIELEEISPASGKIEQGTPKALQRAGE